MIEYIKTNQSAHWYKTDGTPCHQIEKKDKSGLRNVDLRDARKLNLVPSVTSILNIIAKPQLEAWKQEQVLLAALTLPIKEGEGAKEYATRIAQDALAYTKEAAEMGTLIHLYFEYVLGQELSAVELEELDKIPEETQEAIKKFVTEHFDLTMPYETERSIVNLDIGYAGTRDFKGFLKGGRRVIADWKTKNTKPGGKIFISPDNSYQLSAYAAAEGVGNLKDVVLMNVYVSRSEPGRIDSEAWGVDDSIKSYDIFKAACKLWYLIKKLEKPVMEITK